MQKEEVDIMAVSGTHGHRNDGIQNCIPGNIKIAQKGNGNKADFRSPEVKFHVRSYRPCFMIGTNQ